MLVGDDREQHAREAVRRAKRNLPWMFSKEGNREWYRAHLARQTPEFLVAAGWEGDEDCIDLLRKYAREARRTGQEVPRELAELVWELFIDGKPKAKPGSSAKDSSLRNLGIALLVKIVRDDFGFPEYRNPEYRGETEGPMTGCRLVAEEMGLSESRVEKIWTDRKASVTSTIIRLPN
jgi:hypothetical protein